MINYNDALTKLLSQVPLRDTEIINLNQALGRTCALTLTSPEALPAFSNSAMDGFAIQTASVANCSPTIPIQFSIVGTIAAGDKQSTTVYSPQHAYEIMTGAVVPHGYDAVIPIESVNIIDENTISIQETLQPGQNIRYPGEDFQKGDTILDAGTVIQPAHIMILASFGMTQITVYRPIKVVILSTGNELVSIDTKDIAMGQIRNSNGIYTSHALQTRGVNASFLGSFPDDLELVKTIIIDQLNTEPKPDIIITTGAVSAGKWDFIPTLLKELKANILFHKVGIRPGKPVLAAQLTQLTYFIGLPGNPISTAVGLRFFVYPLLNRMQGRELEKPIVAKLKSTLQKKNNLLTFYKAHAQTNSSGELMVEILPGQESFKMKPLLAANCWAVLDECSGEFHANSLIKIYPGLS